MLPKINRLVSSSEFSRATKSGLRTTSPAFVSYLYINRENGSENDAPRAGLIISKAVGGSVVRHLVARKIRHTISANLNKLPQGSLLVVRALTPAAQSDINTEITQAISKLLEKSATVSR